MDQKPQEQAPTEANKSEEVHQQPLEVPSVIGAEVSDELKTQMQEVDGSKLAQPEKPQPLPNEPQTKARIIEQRVSQPTPPPKANATNSSIAIIVVASLVAMLLIIGAVGTYLGQ